MNSPHQQEHVARLDDVQRRADETEAKIARSPGGIGSQLFEAANAGAKTVAGWLGAETKGSGPMSIWLSRVAAGYRQSQSRLIELLPPALEAALSRTIGPSEAILVKLKGGLKEALICTDQKIYIIKMGFLTGNTFGANVFQLPLMNIGSIDVQFGAARWQGHFELLAHGTPSSVRRQSDATGAINCVTLYGPLQARRFRNASSFILDRRAQALAPVVPSGRDALPSDGDSVALLERLADLYEKGLLTREEFDSQKLAMLSRR